MCATVVSACPCAARPRAEQSATLATLATLGTRSAIIATHPLVHWPLLPEGFTCVSARCPPVCKGRKSLVHSVVQKSVVGAPNSGHVPTSRVLESDYEPISGWLCERGMHWGSYFPFEHHLITLAVKTWPEF